MRSRLRFCTNKSIKKKRDIYHFTMRDKHHNDAKITTFLSSQSYLSP